MGTDLGNMIRVFRESKDLSRKEFCKVVGISTSGLAYYENGNREPSGKVLHKIRERFNLPMTYFTNEPEPKSSEGGNMKSDFYEGYIELQKKEIIRLEIDNNELRKTLEQKTPESSHWDDLSYHYTTEVELHWTSFKLLGRTICSVSNLKEQSKILGYSESKLKDMWDVGTKYNDMSKHPIDTILHQDSKDELQDIAKTLPTVFSAIKDMIGNHYIPTKLMYKCKDGSFVGAISYNKIDWRNQKVSSKIAFLITEEVN